MFFVYFLTMSIKFEQWTTASRVSNSKNCKN